MADSGGHPTITTTEAEEVGCLVGDYPHDPHPEDEGVLEGVVDGEEGPGEGTEAVIERGLSLQTIEQWDSFVVRFVEYSTKCGCFSRPVIDSFDERCFNIYFMLSVLKSVYNPAKPDY